MYPPAMSVATASIWALTRGEMYWSWMFNVLGEMKLYWSPRQVFDGWMWQK